MLRGVVPLALALSACAPTPLPTPDAQPDAAAEAAADAQSAPDAEPPTDAAMDASDAAELPDAQPEASSPDVVDAGTPDSLSEAGDASAPPPDINARHDSMDVRATLRLTCAPGMGVGAPDYCDAVKTTTYEGGCSVRGARSQVGFSPFACGIGCYSINALLEGTFTSVTVSAGGSIASGSDVWITPGLEWVDGVGQRRQNFYARVRMAPNAPQDVRGIAGVAGLTALPEYADIYALGCPKGP